MKHYLFILLCLIGFSLYGQKNLEVYLDQLITNWHLAAAQGDRNAYFDLLDQNAVFIGTDSTEYWTKEQFYQWAKPYFDRGQAWVLKANSRHIYIGDSKKFAWWDELLYTRSGTWIGTGILQKKGNKWFICHYTLSVTVPNEKMNEIVKILKNAE